MTHDKKPQECFFPETGLLSFHIVYEIWGTRAVVSPSFDHHTQEEARRRAHGNVVDRESMVICHSAAPVSQEAGKNFADSENFLCVQNNMRSKELNLWYLYYKQTASFRV
jgi:hypothetical protein